MKAQLFGIMFGLLTLGTREAVGQDTLKAAFEGQFLIGTAVREEQFSGSNAAEAALIGAQFNTISPENVLKWDATEPRAGDFTFDAADRYVEFGVKNGMFVIGHTLVWHSQTPVWVFQDAEGAPVDRETLLTRMHDHIRVLVGRYRGKIKGWDVVNEVLAEDGTLRPSPWLKIIGEDYIAKAFEFAHEADPDAELYYNDYSIEGGSPKQAGALALVRKLKAAGVPITAVGIQEHVNLKWPSAQKLDAAIVAFGQLGVKVVITELDIDVLPARSQSTSADISRTEAADPALNPYVDGLPPAVQDKLARRYAELFGVYLKNRGVVRRVTLWGLTDRGSWLNNFPIKGRTNYPLLFDRAGESKLAYTAVIDASKQRPAVRR